MFQPGKLRKIGMGLRPGWTAALCLMPALLCAAVNSGEPADARIPVPPEPALKAAEKTIKDLFKDDYARRALEERRAFAQKLLEQGIEIKDDPVTAYVLLREAAALAIQSGDIVTALNAADEMAQRYSIDILARKTEILAKFTLLAATPEANRLLARRGVICIEAALEADNYDAATKLLALAETLARKAEDAGLVTTIQLRGKSIRELQSEFNKIKSAWQTLQTKADDPEANLAVGKFLAFVKGDWEKALTLLSKGADEGLRNLAQEEIAQHPETELMLHLAEGWLKYSEKQTGGFKTTCRVRAGDWYRLAANSATGLEKIKLEKQFGQIAEYKLVNLTAAAKATASEDPGAHALKNVLDGKYNTDEKGYWFPHNTTNPNWIEFQFPREVNLKYFRMLLPSGAKGHKYISNEPFEYDVTAVCKGMTKTIAKITNGKHQRAVENKDDPRTHFVTVEFLIPVRATSLRFTCSKTNGGNPPAIYEVEIYGLE